jgi:transcriptional regulator with XRE-family HTH domain
MLTEFGKFTRKLRVDNDELLKYMADKLGVSSSYLSSVETGKRKTPVEWVDKISQLYNLDEHMKSKLKNLIKL